MIVRFVYDTSMIMRSASIKILILLLLLLLHFKYKVLFYDYFKRIKDLFIKN